jgi:hypothetical protein
MFLILQCKRPNGSAVHVTLDQGNNNVRRVPNKSLAKVPLTIINVKIKISQSLHLRAPGTHWIGEGWVGPRVGLYTVPKRKIPSPHRDS